MIDTAEINEFLSDVGVELESLFGGLAPDLFLYFRFAGLVVLLTVFAGLVIWMLIEAFSG